ncbi:MAG TPA: hypothetical protein DHM37_08185 [Candidatus Cloacimonas sp.]|jgi:glycosyltransferase involved in cell wall biosynthesis|nr:hypothetical protein [Candidatus Cloacimonadota bacterium]HCX73682.1 hypothetical protein [Candidatus Cloacimonas sp.]
MKAERKNTAIIVPIYNSYEFLEELLVRIKQFTALENVFIIDDGSKEIVFGLVPSEVHFLQHKKNLGKGAALQTGFKAALEAGYSFALTIDSDLQHKPEEMRKFIEYQNRNECDMVIGKRDFQDAKMPWQRKLSNSCTSKMLSWVTRQKIYDSQCGFRLYNLQILRTQQFVSQRYQFETEILLRYAAQDAKIGFVPIATIYGEEQSHISHLRDIWNFLKIFIKEIRRNNEYIVNK